VAVGEGPHVDDRLVGEDVQAAAGELAQALVPGRAAGPEAVAAFADQFLDLAAEAFLDQHHVGLAALAAHLGQLAADLADRFAAPGGDRPGQTFDIVSENADLGRLHDGRRSRRCV
jgi:hypothetical protein